MHISSAEFITSAAKLSQCPTTNLPEFAFFWRSNVGKSSLINLLTQRGNLAKCSKIPWKTRLFKYDNHGHINESAEAGKIVIKLNNETILESGTIID